MLIILLFFIEFGRFTLGGIYILAFFEGIIYMAPFVILFENLYKKIDHHLIKATII
jgi:hypothetical protein